MLVGISTPLSNAAAAAAAGFDFVEENAQGVLQPRVPDDAWTAPAPGALPVLTLHVLVPAELKIVGPAADAERLKAYITTVVDRAARLGVRTLVFGSGASRRVPEGFDLATASRQLVDFTRDLADVAAPRGIAVALEPLNPSECNIVNSVAEAARYVRTVDRPNCGVAVHTFHLWMQDEVLENVRRAAVTVKHVRLADLHGRVAPGLSGKADYRPLFRLLKLANYDGTLSVASSPIPDFTLNAPRVREFICTQWARA